MSITPEQTNMPRGLLLIGAGFALWVIPMLLSVVIMTSTNPAVPVVWGFVELGFGAFALICAVWGGYDVVMALVLTGQYSVRARKAQQEQLDHLAGPQIRDLNRRAFENEFEVELFAPVTATKQRRGRAKEAPQDDGLGEELITDIEPETLSMASRVRAMREARGERRPRPSE